MKSAFYGYFRQSQFLFRHPADRIGYSFPDHVLFRRIAGNVSEMSHETAPRHGGNFQQIFQVKILQIMLVQVLDRHFNAFLLRPVLRDIQSGGIGTDQMTEQIHEQSQHGTPVSAPSDFIFLGTHQIDDPDRMLKLFLFQMK